jgi:peptidyl-prolyl cis-trans isomerase D
MALIKKIRERTGVAVGVVAISLALFIVGGDLLNQNSILRGKSSRNVGEIAGKDISVEDYEKEVAMLEQRYGGNIQENQKEGIRNQAWESLISKIAFQKEFDELGIEVTQEELSEMMGGKNIDPILKQQFTDPATGEFSRTKLDSFYYRYNNNQFPPEQKAQINAFFQELGRGRQRIKFDNLIANTVYVTKEEAKREYENQNTKAEIKYLYVPFYTVNDTAIKVTDDQIKDYVNRNKDKYKSEESASIEYVVFPVIPSAKDTADLMKEINEIADGFRTTTEDSTYARINSETDFNFNYVNLGELPPSVSSQIPSLKKGDVIGPIQENGYLKLFKLSDIKNDTNASVKASHILIKPASESPEDLEKAKAQAQDVLNQLKGGANFETMAMIHSADPGSKNQGGDLGWFTKGRMVPEFEKAVFNFKGTGLIPELVKSQYGYHIIKVTEPKTTLSYRVATIEKLISPGTATNDKAYRKASIFQANSPNSEAFRKNAVADSLAIMEAPRVLPTDKSINDLLETRPIVRWIFNDGEVGKVSEVFSLENKYVVVSVKGKFEKNATNVDNLRAEITPKIKNEIKAKQIVDKLKTLKGSLDEIATKYGSGAVVNTQTDFTFNAQSLNNVGYAPIATGKVFGMKKGQKSEPIVDENGVLIVEVLNITKAPEIADYSMYKDQIFQKRKQQETFNISEAVKEYSDIEDNRSKFY